MSGSGEANEWRFSDDPAHAWVRETWEGMELDPRVL
jgi:5-deoxy-glucuronate isomerase